MSLNTIYLPTIYSDFCYSNITLKFLHPPFKGDLIIWCNCSGHLKHIFIYFANEVQLTLRAVPVLKFLLRIW